MKNLKGWQKAAIIAVSIFIASLIAYVIYKGGVSKAFGPVTEDPDGIEAFKQTLIENRAEFDDLINNSDSLFIWDEGTEGEYFTLNDRNENIFKMKAALVDILSTNPEIFSVKGRKNVNNFKAKNISDYDLYNEELNYVLLNSFGWNQIDQAKFILVRTKNILDTI